MQLAITTALRALASTTQSDSSLNSEQRHVLCIVFTDKNAVFDDLDALPLEGAYNPNLPAYEDNSRSTKDLLDAAYKDNSIAQQAFAAINGHKTKLSKQFYKNGYYFSAANLTFVSTRPSR